MSKSKKVKEKTALTPLRKYFVPFWVAPFMKLIECVIELANPFIVRFIIDEGIKNNNFDYVWKAGVLLFVLSVIAFGVTMVAQYFAARVSADYGHDLKDEIYRHMGSLSEKQLNEFGKQKALTLLSNDSFSMQNGVMMFMRLFLRPPFLIVGATVIAFLLDWRAGFVFLGVVVFSSLVIASVIVLSPKKYTLVQTNLDEISSLGSDALKGARPIRAFDKETYEEKKFVTSSESYKKKSLSIAKLNAFINPFTFFFVNLGMILVVYLGGLAVDTGSITTGTIVSLISFLTLILNALVMFSRMIVSLNRARASMGRINAFFAIKPLIVNNATYKKTDDDDIASRKKPLFSFQNVALSYGGEGKPAVSNLTFDVYKGDYVGIIGGTGSGKSTLIALLERIYDPTEGKIEYRGHDLKDYDLESLHEEISLVSQKPSLFKGTIRSNLLLAKPDATEEEMTKALQDSLAYEYVSRYKDGIDHGVEEAGANLSGGQKQRLLIARALLKGGDILILDDSTSALDYLSDKKVRQNIEKYEGITRIIVSQRATTLADCNLIFVMDKGEIVARGTHEELLKNCSIYHDIYEMQVASR